MRLRLTSFSLPLVRPFSTASGAITARRGFRVELTGEGRHGVGEATPLAGWTESFATCDEALTRSRWLLDGVPVAAVLDRLSETPAARHGLALADLDAAARAAGEPLYRHLGATTDVESVPVNATVGDDDVGPTVSAARDAVDAGFPTVKVKVGARSVSEDVERLRAVRNACPDVELRADANAAWTREQTDEAFDAVHDLDVAYVEQPLSPDDLAGHAAVRGRGVGVALDESVAIEGLDAILAAEAADVVVVKPMALGGPDLARAAAIRGRDAGVDPVVTTTVDAVYARIAAVHVAASLPDVPACGLATADLLGTDLAPDPSPVEDGHIVVPQSPGTVPTG